MSESPAMLTNISSVSKSLALISNVSAISESLAMVSNVSAITIYYLQEWSNDSIGDGHCYTLCSQAM